MGATLRLLARASRTIAGLVLAGVVAGAAIGCGPVRYVQWVSLEADAAVAAARAAGADELAPYWYTLAVEYLHKAREEAALADFEAAHRFGRQAHRAAVEARTLALRRAARPDDSEWAPPAELLAEPPAERGDPAGEAGGEGVP